MLQNRIGASFESNYLQVGRAAGLQGPKGKRDRRRKFRQVVRVSATPARTSARQAPLQLVGISKEFIQKLHCERVQRIRPTAAGLPSARSDAAGRRDVRVVLRPGARRLLNLYLDPASREKHVDSISNCGKRPARSMAADAFCLLTPAAALAAVLGTA
jgi:hypothetical protein